MVASAGKVVQPSRLRRKDHSKAGARAVTLSIFHAAVYESRTLFPTTVKFVEETKRVLKSGHNSSKIGKEVTKGRLRGAPIYTLTLQERATCPKGCRHWRSCYGNNMHFAERIHHDSDFEEVLWLELEALQSKHPDGYLVRLHVLGDFYSEDYVKLWLRALDTFPALHVFGYTARGLESPIGKLLYTAAQVRWDRFAIRFSGEDWRELAAPTVQHGKQHPVAITCPAQTGKTECCGTCTLCWTSRKSVAFEQHGSKGINVMAWAKLNNPKQSGKSPLLPTNVRFKAKELKLRNDGSTRYIHITIGSKAAEQARFIGRAHKLNILVGSGEDAGKLGICLDDASGKFDARRTADGSYVVTIKPAAAAGTFSLTFPPFERGASTMRIDPSQPPVIVVGVTAEFLAYK